MRDCAAKFPQNFLLALGSDWLRNDISRFQHLERHIQHNHLVMAFRMEGRLLGTELGLQTFWSGTIGNFSLTPDGVTEMCERLCLWNFLFENTQSQFVKYLGFLDFDMPTHDFQTMNGGQIVQVFQQELQQDLDTAFPGCWMAYFSGSKGFHVYVLKDEFFFSLDGKDKQDPACMVAALKELLPESLSNKIDTSIYAVNKGIRPWTQKNPKVSVMKRVRLAAQGCPVQDAYDFFEWIADVLRCPCVHSLSDKMVLASRVPRTPEFATSSTLRIAATSGSADIDTLRQWIKDKLGHENLPDVPKQVGENILFSNEDAWCFCDPKELTRHKRCKTWWRIYNGKAEQRCLAERHKEKRFVLSFGTLSSDLLSVKKTVVDFDAEYLPGQVITVDENEKYLPYRMIKENLMPKGSRLLVCSPMGTGKTFSLNRLIKKNRGELKRILVIGTRQSQCCVFHGAFEGSVNYLEPQEKPLHEIEYLVICLNSLMRVARYDSDCKGFVVPYYDLLVIDECMTVLRALVSSLLSGPNTYQPAIFELFKLLLKVSGRVVLMDGLPESQIYQFLSDPRVNLWHHFKILKHVRPSECKKFVFQPDPMVLEKLVFDCMVSDRSVVVVSDSKKILKSIHGKLPEPVLPFAMTICGDASEQVKKSASDPGRNWKNLRYLGYNTALGPGASFDTETKEEGAFDEIIVFITCKTSCPTEIYQLISRIRHPLNSRVYVCVLSNRTKHSILDEAMNKSTAEQIDWMTQRLMNDVIGFDKLAQNLPLTIKRQTSEHLLDWSDLRLNECPLELVRELASEQKLRLVYEPNDFFSLLAWARLEAEKSKDSRFFLKELQNLIQLGGGELEIRNTTKETLSRQKKFMKAARTEGRTKESRQFPAYKLEGRVPPDVLEKMGKMVQVENYETQRRFFSLVRHFSSTSKEEVMQRFSNQIERFFVPVPEPVAPKPDDRRTILDPSKFSRVPITLTATLPEVCIPFQKLVELLGLEFNPLTGHLEGQWTTESISPVRHEIVSVYEQLAAARSKADRSSTLYKFEHVDYGTDTKKKTNFYRSLTSALSGIFQWTGFSVTSTRKRTATYMLDKKTSQLRYAMAGYNCDTLEKNLLNEDALIYFAENHL